MGLWTRLSIAVVVLMDREARIMWLVHAAQPGR